MKQPYFSIVIPTKNRPGMLYDAMASALGQDFDDYEVIVSDNVNDERTQHTINRFQGNGKLRSIRPAEELNMLAHWEWATRQAKGVYVIVLPDRKVLFKNALKNLYRYIHDTLGERINCISYAVRTYDEHKHQMGWNFHKMPSQLFQSRDLIDNFLNQPYGTGSSLDHFFPKTLNSCYRNTYAKGIRNQHGSYFSTPGCTTPDYSSFFINCSQNKEIGYYGTPTILSQGEATSNGRQFGLGKYTAYLNALGLTDEQLYRNIPLHLPIIYNWLVIDFLTIQEKFDGRLEGISINWDNYFLVNYMELMYKRNQGQMSDELIDSMLDTYTQAADRYATDMLKRVKEKYDKGAYARLIHPVYHISPLKKSIMHVRNYILARRSNPIIKTFAGDGFFTEALEAAGFGKDK